MNQVSQALYEVSCLTIYPVHGKCKGKDITVSGKSNLNYNAPE